MSLHSLLMAKPPPPELPTIQKSLKVTAEHVFLRTVARIAIWNTAKQNRDPAIAESYLLEGDETISLWNIRDDTELRRVAVAINEGRGSPSETIDFLPILPDELSRAGVSFAAVPGDTSCPSAARLHVDATFSREARIELLRILIEADRVLGRCSKGEMKKACEQAQLDGCPVIVEASPYCASGGIFAYSIT